MSIKELHKRYNENPATVVVVGSINLDLSSFVSEFPIPNQTISAYDSNLSAGGKGFNQAIAAARVGANVYFVGCVGDDVSGKAAIDTLNENGVDTQFVKLVSGVHTGTANIMVADGGANMIAVSPGANEHVEIDDVAKAIELIEQVDMMICQLECPVEVVKFALTLAKSKGIATVLNPAPVIEGAASLIGMADYVTPNELEALGITGHDPTQITQRQAASNKLKSLGAAASVITLGSEGAYLSSSTDSNYMLPAFKVDAVNTTGAGDTFNGALTCGLARNYSLINAAIYASAASAISVTGKSAYDSAPTHQQVIHFLSEQDDCSLNLEKVS